ncbi:techylectin-5B [Caerostris darwini]|uniref:Techylectin-5B n=1 Tax=Caerostris darwini TaxID=1538125 RepID=A0AAV4N7N5_9ARAC|nr:techylectin-5B [Caerostris darwini]
MVPSARTGHHELRRELASVKELVAGVEKKLDSFLESETGRKSHRLEASLNSLLSKVADINRKSQLLSEIHQDNDAQKEVLQRISRNLEELARKQTASTEKKNDAEIERLDKLTENVQALFQIFGGMNRKIDDLQTRIERLPSACPTSDLKFFITKKLETLTSSTESLSECLECGKDSLKDILHSLVRHPLDNVAKKCSPNDMERAVGRIMESKLKNMMDSLQSGLHFKLEGFSNKLEESIQDSNCGNEKTSRSAHDIAYSHDTPQDVKASGKGETRETPGRIFRKLWRRMTEPINKVGDKVETLAHSLEIISQRHHEETLSKIREWAGKGKGGESCTKQIQAIHNATKETAQRLGHMESRQLTVQNVCNKILTEVEQVKNTLSIESSVFVPPSEVTTVATDAYYEGRGEGYLATSCADLHGQGTTKSGIYTIKPKETKEPFLVFCDLETEGGGWTVLQRRGDFGEKFRQNFSQHWAVYKRGFGDPQREFWIGNDKMHALTTQDDVKLRVELEDFEGNSAYAEYTRFKVADEKKNYKISVGGYHGNATDSLSLHDGKLFSTIDRDNDEVAACCNCADTFGGGWWYYR